MKRSFCFIIMLLLVASIPTVVFAGYNQCDYHPDAPKVWHDEIHYVNDVGDYAHRKVWCAWYTCSVCNDYIGTGGDIYREEIEPHSFVGSTCIECGFRHNNKLTQEELQAKAIQRVNMDGDKIIGKKASVQHAGHLRYSASKYAASYCQVSKSEEFEIKGYTYEDENIWLEVRCGTTSAWISASLVEISGGGNKGTNNEEIDRLYVGMRCRITVSSGRARMGIGTDYPIVEYVGYNDEFTILDVGYANDGTLWFQIMKDGNMCWISSGIATTN